MDNVRWLLRQGDRNDIEATRAIMNSAFMEKSIGDFPDLRLFPCGHRMLGITILFRTPCLHLYEDDHGLFFDDQIDFPALEPIILREQMISMGLQIIKSDLLSPVSPTLSPSPPDTFSHDLPINVRQSRQRDSHTENSGGEFCISRVA